MPASTAIQTIQTSWMVYILALLSFLGWCLMTIFAGIGMVSLPMDMIAAWFNRPRPIDLKQFAEKKIMLKKRCEDLIQEGRNAKDGFKNRPNKFRETRFTNKFRKLVLDLEDDMEMLDMCYKKNQINPLLPFFNLAGGIFCSIITVSWWLQLILEVFLAGLVGPYLSSIFTSLSAAFPLFGIVAYGIFAFYILVASVKGSITFAGRFFLISMHPMKVNGTMMNSFLFNVGQMLLCSISCVQLCSRAFKGFAHSSAISQIFVTQVEYLRYFSWFYSTQVPIFYTLLMCISLWQLLYSIVCICFCPKAQVETVEDAMKSLRAERDR